MPGKRTDNRERKLARSALAHIESAAVVEPSEALDKVAELENELRAKWLNLSEEEFWSRWFNLSDEEWRARWLNLSDVLPKEIIAGLSTYFELNSHQNHELAIVLVRWRGIKRHSLAVTARQDTLRTLRGIANEKSDEKVISAYGLCDGTTKAQLTDAIWQGAKRACMPDRDDETKIKEVHALFKLAQRDAAMVRSSAAVAAAQVARMDEHNKKRRPKTKFWKEGFADEVFRLWLAFGGNPNARAYVNADYESLSPLTSFGLWMFEAVQWSRLNPTKFRMDATEVANLLREARKRSKHAGK